MARKILPRVLNKPAPEKEDGDTMAGNGPHRRAWGAGHLLCCGSSQSLTESRLPGGEGRARLQLGFTKLAPRCAERLSFFDLNDISSWRARTCPLAEVLTQGAQVGQFQSALLRYRALRQQPSTS